MADIKINNVEYNDVPRLDVPDQSGGVSSFYEVSGDLSITENGTYDVKTTESVTVDVAGSGGFTWDDVVQGDAETITVSKTKDMGTYKTIPDHRFRGYTSLKNFKITDSNNYQIGAYAFNGDTSLETLDAPNCLKLGTNSFEGCSKLTEINIPKCTELAGYSLRGTALTEFSSDTVKLLSGYYTFSNTPLQKVSLPKVTMLNSSTFLGCKKLSEVDLPALTYIGDSCFRNCISLTSVSFPLVTSVSGSIFMDCTSLTKVSLPSVETTYSYVFNKCTALTELEAPKLIRLGSYCIVNCALEELKFDSLTTIEDYACYANFSLKKIDLGSSSEGTIGSMAFYSNSKMSVLCLRAETVWTLSARNAFNGTPIASGTGYIYVPSALVDSYKVATNWVTYANQFRALEDYTVDGTITGELDETKI